MKIDTSILSIRYGNLVLLLIKEVTCELSQEFKMTDDADKEDVGENVKCKRKQGRN